MEFKALENERWVWAKTFKDDYSDEYLVSDMGRCWSIRRKKFVGSWSNDDYWTVCLSKSRKQQETMMIGRLMLISFGITIPKHLKGLPIYKLKAMHLDGNSKNNSLNNFAWGDDRENQNEINARKRNSEAHKGEKHPKAKAILQYSKDGTFIREWKCIIDAHRELGIDNSSISKCARGKQCSCGGYVWKYKVKG